MADKTAQRTEDFLTLYTTTLLEVPFAGAKLGLGMGQEREVMEAAWKGYDAWVRLLSVSLDDLYRNPVFGNFVARSLDQWLRWQRLSQAMSGAFFAAFWPAVGLPTAATVQALHEELSTLSIHLKTQDATIHTLRAELRSLQTRSEEMSFLTTGLPTQNRNSQGHDQLIEQPTSVSARRNGNGAVHNGHSGMRTALQKKLTNGHAAKNGNKTHAARPLH